MAQYHTVDSNKWDQDRRKAKTMSEMRAKADERLAEAKRQLNDIEEQGSGADVRHLQESIDKERRRIDRELEHLNEKMRSELARQNVAFRQQIDQMRRSIDRTNEKIDQTEQTISELTRHIDECFQRINDATAKEKERAQAYASQLQHYINDILELHPDKLAPSELEKLEGALRFVQTNLSTGDYQSAIGLAQANIPVAMELQGRLEVLNDTFNRLVVELADAMQTTLDKIDLLADSEANRKEIDLKIDGETFGDYNGDISYWSGGLFDMIRAQFEDLCDRVVNVFEEEMEISNMETALQELVHYPAHLEACSTFSEEEFIVSCNVEVMHRRICDVLTYDNTWRLLQEQTGYVNGDFRESYRMRFEDGHNNIASVVVLPDKVRGRRGKPAEVTFIVDTFYEGELRESDGKRRVCRDAILARLQSRGIDTGSRNKEPAFKPEETVEIYEERSGKEGTRIREDRLNKERATLRI